MWLDHFLLTRVFQPIVNRLGIAPRELARSLIVGAFVSMTACLRDVFLAFTPTMAAIYLFLAAILGSCYVAPQHIGQTTAGRLFGTFAIANALSRFVNDLRHGEANAVFGIMMCLTLWSALYVAACQAPPPRRRKAWRLAGNRFSRNPA